MCDLGSGRCEQGCETVLRVSPCTTGPARKPCCRTSLWPCLYILSLPDTELLLVPGDPCPAGWPITGPSRLGCGETAPVLARTLPGHLAVTCGSQLPCPCGIILRLQRPGNNEPKKSVSAILKCAGMKKMKWEHVMMDTFLQTLLTRSSQHLLIKKRYCGLKKNPKSQPVLFVLLSFHHTWLSTSATWEELWDKLDWCF